ncbi:uncharacterized protein [Lolium perenne]|uniref:uncharacterized protein n=1 Tax=Lolium perenne TaxID=4522 RepID=UPI003A98D969
MSPTRHARNHRLLVLQLMSSFSGQLPSKDASNSVAFSPQDTGTASIPAPYICSTLPTHLVTNSLTEQTLSLAKAKEQSSKQSFEQLRATATQALRSLCCIPADTMTTMATPKSLKKASISGKAWRLLRLAVLWARKGSAARSLRLLKTLRRSGLGLHGRRNDQLRYGEREFSIDETPSFRFRTPSARVLRFIPCIATAVPDTPARYGEDRYFFCDARECWPSPNRRVLSDVDEDDPARRDLHTHSKQAKTAAIHVRSASSNSRTRKNNVSPQARIEPVVFRIDSRCGVTSLAITLARGETGRSEPPCDSRPRPGDGTAPRPARLAGLLGEASKPSRGVLGSSSGVPGSSQSGPRALLRELLLVPGLLYGELPSGSVERALDSLPFRALFRSLAPSAVALLLVAPGPPSSEPEPAPESIRTEHVHYSYTYGTRRRAGDGVIIANREKDEEGCSGDYYDDAELSECGVEDDQLLERAMMEASCGNVEAAEGSEDAGVDVKADEFIAKFYKQMKLQRQISWLQYNEMMHRSVC